jgi:hypothetical protein
MKQLLSLITYILIYAPSGYIFSCIVTSLLSLSCFSLLPLFMIYYIYILFNLPSQYEIDFYYNYVRKLMIFITSYSNLDRFFLVDKNLTSKLIAKFKNKTALYIIHPHGISTLSRMVHTLHNKSPLFNILNGVKIAVHNNLFYMPIARELTLSIGGIPSTEKSIVNALKSGYSVSHSVAGMREIAYCNSKYENDHFYILNRKGHIKIAKSANVPIIPILHWNEQFGMTGTIGIMYPLAILLKHITGHYSYWSPGDYKSLKKWFIRMYSKPDNEPVQHDEIISTSYVGNEFYVDNTKSIDEERLRYIEELKELYNHVKQIEKSNRQLIIE